MKTKGLVSVLGLALSSLVFTPSANAQVDIAKVISNREMPKTILKTEESTPSREFTCAVSQITIPNVPTYNNLQEALNVNTENLTVQVYNGNWSFDETTYNKNINLVGVSNPMDGIKLIDGRVTYPINISKISGKNTPSRMYSNKKLKLENLVLEDMSIISYDDLDIKNNIIKGNSSALSVGVVSYGDETKMVDIRNNLFTGFIAPPSSMALAISKRDRLTSQTNVRVIKNIFLNNLISFGFYESTQFFMGDELEKGENILMRSKYNIYSYNPTTSNLCKYNYWEDEYGTKLTTDNSIYSSFLITNPITSGMSLKSDVRPLEVIPCLEFNPRNTSSVRMGWNEYE